MCLGESLAKTELFLIFTRLVQMFTFESCDGYPQPSSEPVAGKISSSFSSSSHYLIYYRIHFGTQTFSCKSCAKKLKQVFRFMKYISFFITKYIYFISVHNLKDKITNYVWNFLCGPERE